MGSCFKSKSKRSSKYTPSERKTSDRTYCKNKTVDERLESCDTTPQTVGSVNQTACTATISPVSSISARSAIDEQYLHPTAISVHHETDVRAMKEAQVAVKSRLKGFRSSMIWKDIQVTSPTQLAHKSACGTECSQSSDACRKTTSTSVRSPEFCINLDVSSYNPQEVNVRFANGALLVEGRHFSETEYGHEACSFFRKYPVPPGIPEKDISYRIRQDGVLVIHGKTVISHKKETEQRDGLQRKVRVTPVSYHQLPASKMRAVHDTRKVMHQVRRQHLETIPDEDFEETVEDFEVHGDCYVLCMNLGGFSPNEVFVKVVGDDLCVKCEQVTDGNDDGCGEARHRTRLERSYALPKDIDITTISSKMSQDGQMRIQIQKA